MSEQENKRSIGDQLCFDRVMQEIQKEADLLPREDIPVFNEALYNYPASSDFLSEKQDLVRISDGLGTMEAHAYVPYSMDFDKGIKGFLKRFILEMNGFWAIPMSEQQNTFNGCTADVMLAMKNTIESQQEQINSMRDQIARMTSELEGLRAERDGLKQKDKERPRK